jgi:hypothetical protein
MEEGNGHRRTGNQVRSGRFRPELEEKCRRELHHLPIHFEQRSTGGRSRERAGTAITYRYCVPVNEEARVIQDVIHVPERCVKQEPGNTVKCTG